MANTAPPPKLCKKVHDPAVGPCQEPRGHVYRQGMEDAADRRWRHLHRIREHIQTWQRPPSPDEMCEWEGQQRRAVQLDLDALARAGALHLDKGPGGRRYPRLANVRVVLEDVTE